MRTPQPQGAQWRSTSCCPRLSIRQQRAGCGALGICECWVFGMINWLAVAFYLAKGQKKQSLIDLEGEVSVRWGDDKTVWRLGRLDVLNTVASCSNVWHLSTLPIRYCFPRSESMLRGVVLWLPLWDLLSITDETIGMTNWVLQIQPKPLEA